MLDLDAMLDLKVRVTIITSASQQHRGDPPGPVAPNFPFPRDRTDVLSYDVRTTSALQLEALSMRFRASFPTEGAS